MAETSKTKKETPEEMPVALDPDRRVKIKLFKDNGRYKEPLFVQVNDYRAQIPRGVPVEIPYYVAKHIEEMNAQDQSTAMMVETLATEYDSKEKALG